MANDDIHIKVFGRSEIGSVRRQNEDGFAVVDLGRSAALDALSEPIDIHVDGFGVLLAVSDGMGGAHAGDVASALTLHTLRMELLAGTGGTPEAALVASIERANQRVYQVASTDAERTGMGATLTAVLVHAGRAVVAEVGDSRAYVLRGERLVPLTRDQSYVQGLIEQQVLRDEDVQDFEHKHVILQAVGIRPSLVVALNRFDLRQRDRLLLCSDGLTNEVSEEEIRLALAEHADVDAACTRLVECAISQGGADNITVVVADLDGSGLPVSTEEEPVSVETIQAFDWLESGRTDDLVPSA